MKQTFIIESDNGIRAEELLGCLEDMIRHENWYIEEV